MLMRYTGCRRTKEDTVTINKTADQLVPGDVILMYGFEYTVTETELFDTGRVGISLGGRYIDAVDSSTTFIVVNNQCARCNSENSNLTHEICIALYGESI